MPKISQLPQNTSPATADYVPMVKATTSTTSRTLLSDLITLFFGNIPDGSITPADLTSGAATTWVWASYTPTAATLTLGNGVLSGRYIQIGKFVQYEITFKFGSSSSLTGSACSFTLPVTAAARYDTTTYANIYPVGTATAFDTSASTDYFGQPVLTSTSAIIILQPRVDGANFLATSNAMSNANPITWATGDYLTVAGTYEAA